MQVRISNIESKANLQRAVCLLPISVGEPYHEKETLEETLKLIRGAGFAKCIIVVADTLQRHNFLIDSIADSTFSQSEAEARARTTAKEFGDEWLKRNQSCIDRYFADFDYQILRWDDCLAYSGFFQRFSVLDEYYRDRTSSFSRSVNKICGQRISHYLKMGKLDGSDAHISVTRDLIKSYVCEEGAIMLLWRDMGYQYMAYPSSHNPINKEIFDCLSGILQQNGGMELLNIEISEVKQRKKIKKQLPSVLVASEGISLTEKQRQELDRALRDFLPLAISPIFTALRNLPDDPSLRLLFLRQVREKILAIEEDTKEEPSSSTAHDNLVSSKPSAMFHVLPDGSSDKVSSLCSLDQPSI